MTKPTPTLGLRFAVAVVTVLLGTGAAAVAAAEQPDPNPPASEVAAPVDDVAEIPVATEEPVAPEAPAPSDDPASSEVPAPSEDPAVDPSQEAPVDEAPDAPEAPEVTEAPVDEEAPAPPAANPVPAAHEDDEEHEDDHGGPVILVNGQPMHGQGDPKLDGCSITLAISELAEGSHTVAGQVAAGKPSGEGPLVTFDESFEGTSWTQTWALDDLVGDLTQKPNGYRIRVVVTIDDGKTKTSRPFWLACGAPQTGNPYVVVLDKQWLDPAGEVLDGPPAALPEDWAITASSQLGSATCTYPDGSDELVCTYENKGAHEGSVDGLYVPGGKDKTFTVAESALPAGWSNVSGIGTFKPRELCPRGDDGHEDDDHDHEEHARAAAEEEPEGGVCEHVVVNQQDEVPETTTTTAAPTTTTEAVTTTTEGGEVAPAGVDRTPGTPTGTLARTGSEPGPLALVGAAAVALGAAALLLRRRRLGTSS